MYNIFPEFIITVLFSSKYLNAKIYLLYLSIAAIIYVMDILVVSYLIAKNNHLGGTILMIMGIILIIGVNFVPSLLESAMLVLMINLIGLIMNSIILYFALKKKQLSFGIPQKKPY